MAKPVGVVKNYEKLTIRNKALSSYKTMWSLLVVIEHQWEDN